MKRKQPISFAIAVLFLFAIPYRLPAQSVAQQRQQDRLNQALIAAVKRNDKNMVVVLLRLGADANCHDTPYPPNPMRRRLIEDDPAPATADTPLLLALRGKLLLEDLVMVAFARRLDGGPEWSEVKEPFPDTTIVPPSENLPLVKALLDYKADVNVTDQQGYTPLLYAIAGQKKATVHLLLQHGAGRKPENPHSYYAPLVYAVYVSAHNTEILSDLLHQGSDVNQRSKNRDTALNAAVRYSQVETVRLLLSYHADVTNRGWDDETPMATATSILAEANHKSVNSNDALKCQQIIHLLQQAGAKEELAGQLGQRQGTAILGQCRAF